MLANCEAPSRRTDYTVYAAGQQLVEPNGNEAKTESAGALARLSARFYDLQTLSELAGKHYSK